MLPASVPPESLHPSLWRGGQLARGASRVVDTGHAALSAELPGGGWPLGALTDLLLQQPGIGELRLLQPVFKAAGKRPVALVQPTHTPNTQALAYWGIPVSSFMVVRPKSTADALWAVEQILRAGTCSAVVFWQQTVRPEALRRLHVVAQSADSLLFVVRPEYAVRDSSPAPLRLGLKPSPEGLLIDFIKRRGPQRAEPLVLPLSPSPVLLARRPTAVITRLGRPSRAVPAQEPAKVFVLHE